MKSLNDMHLRQRSATAGDVESLAAFTADVLRFQDAARPDARISTWTRDLIGGQHPRFAPSDFSVIEDTHTGAIVSCACLISQTWRYDGIGIEIGQLELIGTDKRYRGHGLVRRQIEALHRSSAERGQLIQAIDGIPWFYRQFGYEMALTLNDERSVSLAAIATAPDPGCRVRVVTEADLPFIARVLEAASSRYLMSCQRSAAEWRYELFGRNDANLYCMTAQIIERQAVSIGVVVHAPRINDGALVVRALELADGDWRDVLPSVLHTLREFADGAAEHSGPTACERIGFFLGAVHPAYPLLEKDYGATDLGAYAWYLRAADLTAVLRRITPVLEERLARSGLAHFAGELRLSFYRDGVQLRIVAGRLVEIAPWRQPRDLTGIEKMWPTRAERASAYFPGLTFLQLLFGYRSLAELQHAFPDCVLRTDEARELLNALFPKRPSNVWPVL